jgi:murein L,D-transpeptidase YafK
MGGFFRFIVATALMAGLSAAAFMLREHRIEPDPTIKEVRRTLPQRLAAAGAAQGQPVFIRIFKEDAKLELWMKAGGRWGLFQSYDICRFSGKLGPKLATGDRQAPEGFYRVGLGQLNPASRHHLSFNLGFPNAYDRAQGRTGSYLMVHGGCSSIGCYAVTDAGVDDIYRLVEAALRGGQGAVEVHIFPFRMTAANMARHGGSRWAGFWRDLKTGYDHFEAKRQVPEISVAKGRYRLAAGA